MTTKNSAADLLRTAPTLDDRARARRLGQIAKLIGVAIAARMLVVHLNGNPFDTTQTELACGLLVVLATLWINRQHGVDLAARLLVVALTAMVSGLIWTGSGIHDTALFALPGLLVFAGLVVEVRFFYALLLYMGAFISLVAWSAVSGYHVVYESPRYSDYDRLFELLLILAASGVSIRMMIGDLHRALQRTQQAKLELEQSQAELAYVAQHDALTDLPNRRMGRDRIGQALQGARRRHSRVAILFIDVDNFKGINDTYGHEFGDKFLKVVGERLTAAVRESDVVSRQGGDEFLVGITDVEDLQVVSAVADKMLALLRKPVSFGDQGIFASCSIGISVFPEDGGDLDTLLNLADAAMYNAKKSGRNAYRFNNPQRMVAPRDSVTAPTPL